MTAIKNRPLIAFIDHSYHQHTKSTNFIFEALEAHAEIVSFPDDSWQKGPSADTRQVQKIAPQIVIFFQTRPRKEQLKQLKNIPVFWVPMRDNMHWDNRYWKNLRKHKVGILAFSGDIHRFASLMGLRSLPLNYYPAVPELTAAPSPGNGINAFFWQRRYSPNWEAVKCILGRQKIDSITLKLDPDPGVEVIEPKPQDIDNYPIRIVNQWLELDEYQSLVNTCDVFFAPREFEGIGMANLEAMAAAKCIVAPNAPTANEYIQPGVSGFLYNLNAPAPIDLSSREAVGARAREQVIYGRRVWMDSLPRIRKFLNLP